jgi:sugar phosphate isomerase/epimerase
MTRAPMGLASTCYMTVRRFSDPLEFLRHAASLGAAGVQMNIRAGTALAVRAEAEKNGMYVEAMVGLPRGDPAPFEASLRAAKEAGALCARTACLGGRRYETFQTVEEWKRFVEQAKGWLRAGLAVAEKVRVPLAVENHKDWTAEEFVALLKEFSSPWLGVCLDTGNNLSLLDEPYEVVDALAPYALSTHIKDMGLAECPSGFLLAEVRLGAGVLDLPRIFSTVRKARPETKLTLEMISRDPLEIPCLRPDYFATFENRPAWRLARLLVLARASKRPLPRMADVAPGARATWEEENVEACLHWARQHIAAA